MGGVWQEDSKGRTTIGAGECDDDEAKIYTLGQKIGSSTQWLTNINQIPEHDHYVNLQADKGAHGHGVTTNNGQSNIAWGYLFQYDGTAALNSGAMSGKDGNHTHQVTGYTNKSGAKDTVGFSIIQSSIVVKRWHRIS